MRRTIPSLSGAETTSRFFYPMGSQQSNVVKQPSVGVLLPSTLTLCKLIKANRMAAPCTSSFPLALLSTLTTAEVHTRSQSSHRCRTNTTRRGHELRVWHRPSGSGLPCLHQGVISSTETTIPNPLRRGQKRGLRAHGRWRDESVSRTTVAIAS